MQTPTILQFCTEFVGIDNTHLTDVKNGFYRSNDSRVNPEHTQIVKKWFSVCESRLASRTLETNSIGSMFILKSKYNWIESKQQIEIINGSSQQATPEQIAQKYKDLEKPVLIDGETNWFVQIDESKREEKQERQTKQCKSIVNLYKIDVELFDKRVFSE